MIDFQILDPQEVKKLIIVNGPLLRTVVPEEQRKSNRGRKRIAIAERWLIAALVLIARIEEGYKLKEVSA